MIEFLHKIGIYDKSIIEYTSRDVMRYWPQICRHMKPFDVILLRGGGFFGNMWTDGFSVILKFIEAFADNRIIVFPQSVYFSESDDGRDWLNHSKKAIAQAKQLTIVARDKNSAELLKKYYENINVFCTPDTVLSYEPKFAHKAERSGALVCLRNDKEKAPGIDLETLVLSVLNDCKKPFFYQNTIIPFNMKRLTERKPMLYKIWSRFASAEVVITDRLHGMIFSAITSTPCIVFDNLDGKVGHQYEWIKPQGYIKFIKDKTQLKEELANLDGLTDVKYDLSKIYFEFHDLILILKSYMRGN